MSIKYLNRIGQKYYLHVVETKTGKPTYYFSMNAAGRLAESVAPGFEIYENPTGRVFLRKILPKLISDDKLTVIERELGEDLWSYYAELQFMLVDQNRRLFQTRRYCHRGRIDDWIDIGERGSLATLARQYIKHLGQESYFELF